MQTKVFQPVSVVTRYDHKKAVFMPVFVYWKGSTYKLTKLGYHHKYKTGNATIHIFSVLCGSTFLRLRFDALNLTWELEEICDEV